MTWFGEKIERKRDILTDAMEGFWGTEPKQEQQMVTVRVAPSMVNPTGTMMAMEVPTVEQNYNIMDQTGNTIKDQVEQSVNATQDLTPDVRAGVQYMGPAPMQMQQRQRNPFDIGGFDEMIGKQMARERGAFGLSGNMGLGLGIGSQGSRSAMERDIERFNIMRMKQTYAEQQKATRLSAMDFARQSQSRAMAERANIGLIRQVAESGRRKVEAEARRLQDMSENERLIAKARAKDLKAQADAKRYAAGLPVYNSFWDSIAGGRVKKEEKIYSPEGKLIGERSKIEREGGLFGAFGSTIDFAGKAGRQLDEFQETARLRAEAKRIKSEKLEKLKVAEEYNKKIKDTEERVRREEYKSPFSTPYESQIDKFLSKEPKQKATYDIDSFMDSPKQMKYESEIDTMVTSSSNKKEKNPFEFSGSIDIIDKGIKSSGKLENSYSSDETDEKLINDIMSK